MKKKYLPALLVCFCFSVTGFSQSVAINNTGNPPDPSAILDLSSTTKGLLIPRMNANERNAIVNPAEGLIIYDTEEGVLYHYTGPVFQWQKTGIEGFWEKNFNTVYTMFNVGINTDAPDASALLEMNSTTKGLLIPRMTSDQRNAIVNPAIGLMVYDIWINAFFMFQSGAWQEIGLATWRKNINDLYHNTGNVGIGTNTPQTSLHIRTGQPVSMVNHGFLMLGNQNLENLIFDANEIQTRDNGLQSPLYLNRSGGRVNIGGGPLGTQPVTSLFIPYGEDAGLDELNSGFLMLGTLASQNIVYDNNEIQSRNNGVSATLFLQQDGGKLQTGTTSAQNIWFENNEIQGRFNGAVGPLVLQHDGSNVRIGHSFAQQVWLENNEIQGRLAGSPSELVLQNDGSRVRIGSSLDAGNAKLLITGGSDVNLNNNGSGFLMMGGVTGSNIIMDNNEIQARDNGVAAELTFQHSGSRVVIGNSTDAGNAKLLITGGADLSLADNASGFLMMGSISSTNMVMDNNEIQVRNNGVASPLSLNYEGGGVRVGNGAFSAGVEFGVTGDAVLTGNVRIGNTSLPAGFKLGIDGKVICEELQVKLAVDWADYVFDENYQLLPLPSLEKYIRSNKHLPNIPSAKNLEQNGLALGEMQRLQMEKIEELTLYVIELNKQIELLKKENEQIKQTIKTR